MKKHRGKKRYKKVNLFYICENKLKKENMNQGTNYAPQITRMKAVTGNYKQNVPFLVKNDSEDDIRLEVKFDGSDEYIETTFYVGWNPEVIIEIKNAPAGIQIGY